MSDTKAKIQAQFPGVIFNEKLSKYSTFQVGGPADFFYKVDSLDAQSLNTLSALLSFAKEVSIPVFFLGGGSNTLFADEGFRGLIIKIESREIEKLDNSQLKVDAGVPIPSLIMYSAENSLTGLEPWMGLPGTVGGALRGNAGCNGLETSDILKEATLLNLNDFTVHTVDSSYFEYSYRSSKIKKQPELVLQAVFQLQPREISLEEQKERIKEFNQLRIKKQPFGSTTGSFFKNPNPKQPAGMLIEQIGLKGHQHGKAKISDKHANFFLNLGGATAKEILELSQLAIDKVKESFGLTLEPEVVYLPENGF